MRQLVEVIWVDSTHVGGWDITEQAIQSGTSKCTECKTLGYLLASEPDRIVVAQSMSEDEEICDSRLVIPAQAILQVRYLGPATQVGTVSD